MNKGCLARAALVAAVFIGLPLYWWAFPPREPIGTANGVYANACCGTIELRDGAMTFGRYQVTYVVEYDKGGRYVLPEPYVGVSGHIFVVRRTGYPLKLRLGDEPHPSRIDLIDDVRGQIFSFERVSGS